MTVPKTELAMTLKTAASAPRDRSLFLTLINRATALTQLHQTHAQIVLHGLHNDDVVTVTKLAHRLFDLRAISHARKLAFSFPHPDPFLFNVLVRGFSRNGDPFSALSAYLHLRRNTRLRPDNFTFAFVISALSSSPQSIRVEEFKVLVHAQSIVSGYGSELFVGSAIVDMYFKASKVGQARKVFDGIFEPDTVLWNTVICGLVGNSRFEESVAIFRDMVGKGTPQLDSTTLTVLLPAAAELHDLELGRKIQSLALKFGFHSQVHVLTGLISLYSKCGDFRIARLLFEEIRRPDIIAYNAMIAGYSCNNEMVSSVSLFREMLGSGCRANSSTIVGLIPVFSPFGHLKLIFCIHSFSIKSSVISKASVSTALTTVYSKLDEIGSARRVFDEASERNLASWNAMISGYTQNGLMEKAISLFREMQAYEISPNPVTAASILSACAQLGALSLGKWVHNVIKRENFGSNVYVSTALVDMYAKCGSISEAMQLFNTIENKNVVTWNAMISGFGLHGLGHEAMELFSQMLLSGIRPSGVTFLSALYACSHSGMVREGNKIFHSMIHDHGFQPLPEHYACMVDLLGRAGQLNKALEFIEEMCTDPGPAVWSALLGACMIHKDAKLARVASNKLFELDPENTAYYVLLSNIYTVDQKYPEAALVRQVAKKRKLVKTPGYTLIEVGETPHIFMSGDWSHPQSTAIYAELERLMGKMREAGFQSEMVASLHDVEEEEKEMLVKVHSEKLAIAFGLIMLDPGTEIRLIKNLRVCTDCHNATKFISKITERVIVVRDANRFHHFKDGACSCGDYW